MSRPKGSKNFNRRLLQDILLEKNIDLVDKAWAIISDPNTPVEITARMVMQMFEYVFPKRRAEDAEGTPDQGVIMPRTEAEVIAYIKAAREE